MCLVRTFSNYHRNQYTIPLFPTQQIFFDYLSFLGSQELFFDSLMIILNYPVSKSIRLLTPNNQELSSIHLHQIPRMPVHQNILLLGARNMGIYLRRTDRAVSQHPLYIPDIDILLQ